MAILQNEREEKSNDFDYSYKMKKFAKDSMGLLHTGGLIFFLKMRKERREKREMKERREKERKREEKRKKREIKGNFFDVVLKEMKLHTSVGRRLLF